MWKLVDVVDSACRYPRLMWAPNNDDPLKKARFDILGTKDGDPRNWVVRVTLSDGRVRRVSGFTSEEIAVEWIAKASQTYLRNLEKPWNPLRRREKPSVWNPAAAKRKAPRKRG